MSQNVIDIRQVEHFEKPLECSNVIVPDFLVFVGSVGAPTNVCTTSSNATCTDVCSINSEISPAENNKNKTAKL